MSNHSPATSQRQPSHAPVTLITGSASGIGLALAHEFHARGHIVYATARRPDALRSLAEKGLRTVELEVTDANAIERLMQRLSDDGVTVDVLINNAGFGAMGPLMDMPLNTLRHQFEVNVHALLALTQAVVPGMVARKSGRIVNISSVSGVLPTPFAGAYCASKAAVNALSDALRMELAPFGIQVLTVQPGGIQSNFGDAAAQGLQLAQGSLYAPVQDAIMARAQSSQDNATPAAEFARQMADAVLAEKPDPVIRIGEKSRLMPALKKWLPEPMIDRILSKRFGLNRLGE